MSWRGSRISVVFPTYNERDSIRAAILDFAAIEVIDEIIVVNNNAAAGTSDEVSAAVRALSRARRARQLARTDHVSRRIGTSRSAPWGSYGIGSQIGLISCCRSANPRRSL